MEINYHFSLVETINYLEQIQYKSSLNVAQFQHFIVHCLSTVLLMDHFKILRAEPERYEVLRNV